MIRRIEWPGGGGDGPRRTDGRRRLRLDQVTVSLDAPPRVTDDEVELDVVIEVMWEDDEAE